MPFAALLLPILVSAAQAPVIVTGHARAPFISLMGEPFRPRTPGEDTLANWFRQADRNRDSMLTADEMQADAERFFATLDTDRDGEIDPEELVEYEWQVAPEVQVSSRFRPAQANAEPARRKARRKADGDEDSSRRSSDGLDRGLQGGARYALLNIPQPVAAADTNLDRATSLSEFRQAAIARFQLLDSRREGKVSLQELRTLRPSDSVAGGRVKRRRNSADTRYGVPLPPGD